MTLLGGECGLLGEHGGVVRPYISGPRCTAHAPWTLSALPAPAEPRKPRHSAVREPLQRASEPSVVPGKRVTSHAAARAALPKSGTQRRRILDALYALHLRGQIGATDVQLCAHLQLDGNSVRPRRGELVDLWLVRDTGTTRHHHGTEHTVWAVTNDAVAALRRHGTPDAPAAVVEPAAADRADLPEAVPGWYDKM